MMSKPIKTLAIGAEWVLIGMFIAKLLGYVYRLIVARIGASEYGALSFGIAFISILVTVSIIGLDKGILRYVSFYKAKDNEAKARGSILSSLVISGILSIFAMLVVIIYSQNIALSFFGDKSLAYIIQILAITLPFYIIAKIFLASLRAFKKIKYVIYSEYLIENVLKIITALILIYFLSLGILGAALAQVIALISVAFFSFYFLHKYVFSLFGEKDLSVGKKIFFYSWPLMVGSLSAVLLVRIDSLMIGYLLKDAAQIGIYNAAVPTAMLMLMSIYIVLSLFTPVMSELLAKEDSYAMKNIYKSVIKWSFLVNFPLFLMMAILSKDILRVLFGEVYVAGWSALAVLAGGYFIYSMCYASRNVLEVFKKTKLIMIDILCILVLNIILNYILISKYGIVGAAISTAISLTLLSVLYLIEAFIVEKTIPFDIGYIKLVLINLICFFLVYKVMNLILNISFLYFILFGAVFFVLYFISLIKLKCLNEEELALIKSFRNKISLHIAKR